MEEKQCDASSADAVKRSLCINLPKLYLHGCNLCIPDMLSYIWCLADNRIFVQCYPGDALGIPAEETSHSSWWWRETTFEKCLAQIDCLELNCNFCSLTVSTVFLRTVNTSDNKTLPEGGVHGENWPNSPSTIWIYLKNQLDLFTFVIYLTN